MDDHDLIIAMGEKGLGITWSRNKNWTQVSKAKRGCKLRQKQSKTRKSEEIQMQIKTARNQGVTNLPPLG